MAEGRGRERCASTSHRREEGLAERCCARQEERTPLHLAVEAGHAAVVEQLLVAGANASIKFGAVLSMRPGPDGGKRHFGGMVVPGVLGIE